MIEAVCVEPKMVCAVWDHVAPVLRRAEGYSYTSFEQIERDVLNGHALLWLAVEDQRNILGAVITQKSGTDCVIVALAGSALRRWMHLEKAVEEYARAEGCKRMIIIGRKGWKRVLRHYRPLCVALQRDL